MLDKILLLLYFGVLFTSFAACIAQKNRLGKADKWICILLIATIASEASSEAAIALWNNNMYVYHVWNPIELTLICFYFEAQSSLLNKFNIGKAVAITGVALAVVNAAFLQNPSTLNSIFLLYEGFTVIGLSLFAYYSLVQKEEEILNNTHFWFTTIFLIYWSVVFVYWGLYQFLITSLSHYYDAITYSLWIINIISYGGIAAVFLNYKKMTSKDG